MPPPLRAAAAGQRPQPPPTTPPPPARVPLWRPTAHSAPLALALLVVLLGQPAAGAFIVDAPGEGSSEREELAPGSSRADCDEDISATRENVRDVFIPLDQVSGKLRQWIEIQPVTPSVQRPHLALLMVIYKEILNPGIWFDWIVHTRKEGLKFSMFIHASGIDASQALHLPIFSKFHVQKKVKTRWCHLFDAEMLLVRTALNDSAVTHLAMLDQGSVPLKPLSYIYSKLEKQPATRMCMDWNFRTSARAETWWLVTRGDAELFRDHEDIITAEDFHRSLNFSDGCEEENYWAYPLFLRSRRWSNSSFLDECVMMADWSHTCKNWSRVISQEVSDGSFANMLSEPHDNLMWHPKTYSHVGAASWEELRRSKFWFGRKFASNSFRDVSKGATCRNKTRRNPYDVAVVPSEDRTARYAA